LGTADEEEVHLRLRFAGLGLASDGEDLPPSEEMGYQPDEDEL
jgi:hypothetical protein